jgi:cell pole-organizing protein PopZ
LRSSVADEQAYVDEFITGDVSSGTVSYTPDYSDWSLETPLVSVVPPDADTEEHQDMAVPLVSDREVTIEDEIDEAINTDVEPEAESEADADEPAEMDTSFDDTDGEPSLQLEAMIRQVIEPELVIWIDKHLPDQVAAAMPSEEAFTAMIRPMIEEWLADNLSPIVEVAVREEIARITGLRR